MRANLTVDSQRLARIEQMIAEYHAVKTRRLMQRALNEWHNADHARLDLEKPPTRVH
jgi:hypothetical protein